MYKPFFAIALVAGLSATAAPAATAWQVGNNSYVIRLQSADLADAAGRAALLQVVERAAGRLCAGVSPRRAAARCIADNMAAATGRLPIRVRQAIELARTERDGLQLAARR